MKSIFKHGMACFCIGFILVCLNSVILGQKSDVGLLDRKVSLVANGSTFIYVLGSLVRDQKVPIGLEKSVLHVDKSNIYIDVKNTRLEDLLNQIVAQEPEYEWKLANGVINFTPVINRNDFVARFLDLRLERVVHPKCGENDAYTLKKRVFEMPVVSQLMNAKGVKEAGFLWTTPSQGPVCSTSESAIFFSNVTIREYLNSIISTSANRSWVIEMVGDRKELILLSY